MEANRLIKYRAKGVNTYDGWVQGGLYYTDNKHNNLFGSTLINTKYFIVSYFNHDFNMGGWKHVEVFPKTIQQFTGVYDSSNNEIYEGSVLRVYGTSYDEDGFRSVSTDFIEGVVIFDSGSFVLDTGNSRIEFPLNLTNNEIEVVGNVLTLINNQTANDYRGKLLIKDFEKNIKDTYPEFIDAAFITFAKEASQIIMDDYICTYNEVEQTLSVKFKKDSNIFIITKNNLDGIPEYTLYLYDNNNFLEQVVNKIKETTDFQLIYNFICKKND